MNWCFPGLAVSACTPLFCRLLSRPSAHRGKDNFKVPDARAGAGSAAETTTLGVFVAPSSPSPALRPTPHQCPRVTSAPPQTSALHGPHTALPPSTPDRGDPRARSHPARVPGQRAGCHQPPRRAPPPPPRALSIPAKTTRCGAAKRSRGHVQRLLLKWVFEKVIKQLKAAAGGW